MIQRIQTVFLIIANVLVALPLTGLELISYSVKDELVSMNVFSLKFLNKNRVEPSYFFLMNIFLGLFGFFVTMSYKRLKKQLNLAKIYIGLILFVCAMPIILAIGRSDLNLGIGLYLCLSAIVFVLLAARGISKDKKLLDSLNRLR